MEQWGSEFSLDVEVDEPNAIEQIADAFTKPADGGSYEAYLIWLVESKYDKYDNATLTPTEKVVYSFEQYSYPTWKHSSGGYGVKSYHCDLNTDEVDLECKRLNGLIRNKVFDILENRRKLEEKEKEEQKEKEAKKKELNERQQLADLQRKYVKE